MAIEFTISNFVNLLAFLALTIATYTIFYFGRMMNLTKGVGLNLFTLSLGINLIGLSYLFRIWLESTTSPIILIMVASGAVFMAIGVIWVFYEKGVELSNLKRRENEIKSIIAKLKEKYYQQELSEGELKNVYSELLRELAEIEVKIIHKKAK